MSKQHYEVIVKLSSGKMHPDIFGYNSPERLPLQEILKHAGKKMSELRVEWVEIWARYAKPPVRS